ncbi:hypothetical protein SFRURICE_020160 [Spodoptera frugiperda]|nr:hypothetical protein SFRURICE_020160 [Spodoptera frugiperda]
MQRHAFYPRRGRQRPETTMCELHKEFLSPGTCYTLRGNQLPSHRTNLNNFRKTNANVLRSKIQIFVPIKLFFHTIGLSNNEQRSNEKSAQCETGLVADSRMALHFRFIELAFDSIH